MRFSDGDNFDTLSIKEENMKKNSGVVGWSNAKMLSEGWQLTKAHYGKLVKMAIVLIAVQMSWGLLSEWVDSYKLASLQLIMALLFIPYFIILTVVSMNAVKSMLFWIDGKKDWGVERLFELKWRKLGSYIAVDILTDVIAMLPISFGLMMVLSVALMYGVGLMAIGTEILEVVTAMWPVLVLGLLVLAVAVGVAVYLGVALMLSKNLVIDKEFGPIVALEKSWQLTKGNRGRLLWFSLIAAGVNVLGFLALMVGLLATIPMTMFASLLVYRKLLAGSTSDEDNKQVLVA